jgi:signal transduction histidine kinase
VQRAHARASSASSCWHNIRGSGVRGQRGIIAAMERLVPEGLRGDVDTRRRAQLTVGTTLTIIVGAAAIIPVLVFALPDPRLVLLAVLNTVATIVLAGLSLLLLRHRLGLVLAGNWIAGLLYVGTAFAVVAGGGVGAPFWVLLTLVPVLAAIIAGRTSGLVWLGLCVAFVVGLFGLQSGGVVFHSLGDPASELPLTTAAMLAIIVSLTVFTWLSETTKREAIEKIAETSQQLALALQDEQRSRDAAAQANAANAAKSAFLTTMSHELRTPLNVILGYGEIVLENLEERGDADDAEDVRKIHTAGLHLLGLISDVLDLSRIEAERIELRVETFDLGALVRELEATFRPLATRSGSTLTASVPAELEVCLDQSRVRQILGHLLGNAVKFTRGGQVWLRVDAEASAIVITVEDTGIGIAADKLEQIFEPFTQVDGSFTRRHDGTGLGLAICRRLCDLMGGSLTVRSAPGRGTAFTLRLPRA